MFRFNEFNFVFFVSFLEKNSERRRRKENENNRLFEIEFQIGSIDNFDENKSRLVKISRKRLRTRKRDVFSLFVVGSASRRVDGPTCCLVPRNIHGHYYVSKYHFQPYDYRKLEPSCLRAVLKEENYERKEREREMGPRKRDDTVMVGKRRMSSRGLMPLQNRFLFPPFFFYSPFFPPSGRR